MTTDTDKHTTRIHEVTYGTIRENYEFDGKNRTAYGIAVYAPAAADRIASVFLSFHDISPAKEQIEALVNLCNACSLSPVHLSEVIEDYLAQ